MKAWATITIVLIMVVLGSGQKPISLQEAIDYALANHPQIRLSALDIEDAQLQIEENRAFGLPKISFITSVEKRLALPVSLLPASFLDPSAPEDSVTELEFGQKADITGMLDVQSMVFDFSYFVGLRAARTFKDVTQEEFLSKQIEIKHQVIEAYLPILVLNENEIILDKNVENIDKLLYETEELYKAGFLEELEVDRLRLSRANLILQKDNLKRQREQGFNYLKFTMGYPMGEEISTAGTIDEIFVPATSGELEDKFDHFTRKDYRALDLRQKLNEINEQYNKSTFYPYFSAYGAFSINGQGDKIFGSELIWNDASFIGLKATIPIFDGLAKKSKFERSKVGTERIKSAKSQLESAIDLEVANARTSYNNSLALLRNSEENLALAEKIYETTKIKYQEGVGSSVELTQAEQALYQSQRNNIQAKYELLRSKSLIDKAYGK
jgi:outer membrane protein TolC